MKVVAFILLMWAAAALGQTDPSTQTANSWVERFQRGSDIGEVTHPYENFFVWDIKNDQGVVFGGHLGTYYGMETGYAVPEIMNTNMTYYFTFSDNLFHKAFPMDRPAKRCGVRGAYDELMGMTLALGGAHHNYANYYLMPSIRMDSLASDGYYEQMDYPNTIWGMDGKSRQWYSLRPLIVEGPPKGSFIYSGYYFNMTHAKEYGLTLIGTPKSHRVFSYSVYLNQWTALAPATGETVFPPEGSDGDMSRICAAYDILHQKMVIRYANTPGSAMGSGQTWAYDVGTRKWQQVTAMPTPPNGTSTSLFGTHSALSYDRKNGVLLYLLNSGSQTWALNLGTNTWVNRTPSGNPPSSNTCGGGLEYDPKRNVHVVYTVANNEVWTYKYGPGIANRPESPADPKGVTDASGITLTWAAPSGGAAATLYYVYRAAWEDNKTVSSGCVPGPYVKIDSTAGLTWRDADVATLKTAGVFHSYVISAVSAQGVESDFSTPVFTVPSVPMGLTATVHSKTQVFLRWKPKAESDVTGYNVYRQKLFYPKHNQIKAGKLNVSPVTGSTVFTDNNITLYATAPGGLDSIVMYVVTAVNALGKESGLSPYTITHPEWVNNMWVDTTNKVVTWSPPHNGKITAYRVYEGRQGTWNGGSSRPIQVATVTDTFWSYAGRTVSAYKIRAVNGQGQVGHFSDVMAVQSKDDDAFGNFRLDYQMNKPVRDDFFDNLPPIGVEAAREPAADLAIGLSPNPVSGRLLVSIGRALGAGGRPDIGIFDLGGRRIAVPSVRHEARSTVALDVHPLPAGVYLVKVETSAGTARKKLIVLR